MRNLALLMLATALVVGCGDDPVTPDTDSGPAPDAGGDTDGGGADEDGGGTDEDGGGTDEDGGGGDDGGTTPTLDCASYCATIEANCTGDNDQYGPDGSCMAICATFAEGAIDDMAGNTLGCRLYHAGAAAGDAATHCPHAGPLGDGVCGDACESFCAIDAAICPGTYAGGGGPTNCARSCDGYEPGDYSAASSSGATLACRMYHLTAASESAAMATTHCPHTGLVSTTCVPAP